MGSDTTMKGALWVCERDIRKFVRQPFMVISAVVGPLLTLVLLGYAFGGTITHVPVAVVRDSVGPYSSRYIDIVRTTQNCAFGGVNCGDAFRLRDVPDLDMAERLLREGQVKAIVYIPLSFDDILGNSNSGFVTVYLDNTDPLSSAAAAASLTKAAQQLSTQTNLVSSLPSQSFTLDQTNLYRNVMYVEFMAPGSLVQSVMFSSVIGGGVAILFDKQRGIIEGYLVTPLRRYEIVMGVLLAGVIKAMFSTVTLLIIAVAVVGVRPMTDAVGFTLMLFTLFLTALGLISMMTAYAVRAPAPEVYQFTAFPINLILYFTSGAVYPTDGFPNWMKTIATVNPEAYAVHALRSLMYKGASLPAVVGDFAYLSIFTAIMCGIATFAFRRAL